MIIIKRLDRIDFHNKETGKTIIAKGYVRPELYDQILVINLDVLSCKLFESFGYPSLEVITNILTKDIFNGNGCTITVTDTSTNASKGIYYGFSTIGSITLGITSSRNVPTMEKEKTKNYWVTLIVQKPNLHIDTKVNLFHQSGNYVLDSPNRRTGANANQTNRKKKSYYMQP